MSNDKWYNDKWNKPSEEYSGNDPDQKIDHGYGPETEEESTARRHRGNTQLEYYKRNSQGGGPGFGPIDSGPPRSASEQEDELRRLGIKE